jgi:hypothetical protein
MREKKKKKKKKKRKAFAGYGGVCLLSTKEVNAGGLRV